MIGQFNNNMMNGLGTYHFIDKGNVYKGYFKDDKMEGYGEYMYYDGNKYIGEFKDNKLEGIGIFEFSFGDVYKGEFSKDKMCGVGKYIFSDGDYHEKEEFKNKDRRQRVRSPHSPLRRHHFPHQRLRRS